MVYINNEFPFSRRLQWAPLAGYSKMWGVVFSPFFRDFSAEGRAWRVEGYLPFGKCAIICDAYTLRLVSQFTQNVLRGTGVERIELGEPFPPEDFLFHCDNCPRTAEFKCGGCGLTRYCSRECAKADWNSGHAADCPYIAEFFKSGSP